MAIRIGQAKIHNDAWRCCLRRGSSRRVRSRARRCGAWASFLNLTADEASARVMFFAALQESGCAGRRNG
jgi:hypothetical protein